MLELSRDAAVQSERVKSEFIRNMSHEFRTPLSIVIGMTSILKDSDLTPEQRELPVKWSTPPRTGQAHQRHSGFFQN